MENLKIDILTASVKDVATTTELGKFECVAKAIGDEASVNHFFDYVSKWPPNIQMQSEEGPCSYCGTHDELETLNLCSECVEALPR